MLSQIRARLYKSIRPFGLTGSDQFRLSRATRDKPDVSVAKSTSGYVRLFGFKADKNILTVERRRAQRALMTGLLLPLYAVPFLLNEIAMPFSGSFESVSIILPLLAIHLVSAARLNKEYQLYPHVFGVLFHPYSGDIILMREDWSSFLKMRKKPKLIPIHIPLSESENYKIIPTSSPQGCVIQMENKNIIEGNNVGKHHGYLHFSNIFNHEPFDNYMNEMSTNKILEQMITVRFDQDHRYYKPTDIYEHLDGLMTQETGKLSPEFYANVERRQMYEEKMKHPMFRRPKDIQERYKGQ
jgi:hypothetical protein